MNLVPSHARRRDVRAPFQLDPVEHHHRQPDVVEAAAHQLLKRHAGALNERPRHRRLRRRARLGLDASADRLLRSRVAARRDAGKHPLQHDPREQITIGERGHDRCANGMPCQRPQSSGRRSCPRLDDTRDCSQHVLCRQRLDWRSWGCVIHVAPPCLSYSRRGPPRRFPARDRSQCIAWPPSMLIVCPIMKPASSEDRNTTAPAMSSGRPLRLIACRPIDTSIHSGSVRRTVRVRVRRDHPRSTRRSRRAQSRRNALPFGPEPAPREIARTRSLPGACRAASSGPRCPARP